MPRFRPAPIARLRLCLAGGWLAAVLHGAAAASSAVPEPLRLVDEASLDDPRAAITLAGRVLQAGPDAERRFWTTLGLARAQTHLEQGEAAHATLAGAQVLLAGWPDATERHRLWLDLVTLEASWTESTPPQAQAHLKQLRQHPQARNDAPLQCAAAELDATLLIDIDSLDEAWLAAEEVERCGRQLGLVAAESGGIATLGLVASRSAGATPQDPQPYFERALKVLGERPARMRRSLIAWDRGVALKREDRLDDALQHYRQARVLSDALGDRAGMAAADIEMASVHLRRKAPTAALPLLGEASKMLQGQDNGYRLQRVTQYTVEALTQLRRPDVVAAITQARRWDTPTLPAGDRAQLARVLAAGYASQGRFAEAYAEVERAEAFGREGRAVARDTQMLRLQARYANAQRDAESAEWRHRSEAARLALAAEVATQRALWAALATLALVLLGGGSWAWRVLSRRRALARLALRDELTGQPNRRAVSTYAQAQFEQAHRLGVPLSVALIDLDHFKRVNDTLGHAGGDAVLRAFGTAATDVLRGQDRLGRWGGEEWLLVMPGSSVHELPAVFERLRARFATTPATGVDGPHGCTFSMGAAQVGAQTTALDALIEACDQQLYRAKAEGRNTLRFAA